MSATQLLAAVVVAAITAAGSVLAVVISNRAKARVDEKAGAVAERAEDRQQFDSILGGLRGMVDVQKEALATQAAELDRMAAKLLELERRAAVAETRADGAERRADLAASYARDLSRWATAHAALCNAEAATPPPPAPVGLDVD